VHKQANSVTQFELWLYLLTVVKPDSPGRKLLVAKKNFSQRPNMPSISAAHQTVNLRATSTAEIEAVDSYL
jgi:hypothetical protein